MRAAGVGDDVLHLADAHAPDVGPGFEVVPTELALGLGLELVLQRLGIVVVDQHQRLARRQLGEAAENQRVALARG
jgi:hypothetical protein